MNSSGENKSAKGNGVDLRVGRWKRGRDALLQYRKVFNKLKPRSLGGRSMSMSSEANGHRL